MRHTVNLYAPNMVQDGTSQAITGYTLVQSSVPCFIQPASAALQFYYSQRGSTISHTIYTNEVDMTFTREYVLEDQNGNQYHTIADPLNALESNIYLQLVCEQYPEGAKKRLDIEEYEWLER